MNIRKVYKAKDILIVKNIEGVKMTDNGKNSSSKNEAGKNTLSLPFHGS